MPRKYVRKPKPESTGGHVDIPDENQEQIPGNEFGLCTAQIEIGPLARDYVAARDARMKMTPGEREAKTNLLVALRRHNCEVLSVGGMTIKLIHGKDNVKVKVAGGGQLEIDEDEMEDADD